MKLEQAIKDAIAAGWDGDDYAFTTDVENAARPDIKWDYDRDVLLDPAFWQALGKARGWKKTHYDDSEGNYDECWECKWHSLIDHLISGKSIEEFFETL